MPPEADPDILKLLLRILRDRASNVVSFTETARGRGHRTDEGVNTLLPAEWSESEKCDRLRRALAEFIERGERPNRREEAGDREMQLDTAVFHEFRVAIEGVALYVKTTLDAEDDPDDPILWVISVKRDDQAVK